MVSEQDCICNESLSNRICSMMRMSIEKNGYIQTVLIVKRKFRGQEEMVKLIAEIGILAYWSIECLYLIYCAN